MTDVDTLRLIDGVNAKVTIFAGDVFFACDCGKTYQMNWRVLQAAAQKQSGREIVCGSCGTVMAKMDQPL